MARKSRSIIETARPKYRVWRIAIYIRLSKEDARCFDESESVTNQRKIIEDHITEFNDGDEYMIVDEYVDDSDIFEPSQKVLAKPSVFLIWSNFLSFWANIHGGVAWDIFFLPVILREGAEKQLLY